MRCFVVAPSRAGLSTVVSSSVGHDGSGRQREAALSLSLSLASFQPHAIGRNLSTRLVELASYTSSSLPKNPCNSKSCIHERKQGNNDKRTDERERGHSEARWKYCPHRQAKSWSACSRPYKKAKVASVSSSTNASVSSSPNI